MSIYTGVEYLEVTLGYEVRVVGYLSTPGHGDVIIVHQHSRSRVMS